MDHQLFRQFINEPTPEAFARLRAAQLASPDFEPYSRELDGLGEMLREERHAEALKLLSASMSPNHLLSPGAHLKLAMVHKALGQVEESEGERAIGLALLEGIAGTGDGTEQQPYRVTRTSDEYDVLIWQNHQFGSQSLRETDGRRFDVLLTKEGRELWFEVTEIFALMAKRLRKDGTGGEHD